jgi:hypothetical protein
MEDRRQHSKGRTQSEQSYRSLADRSGKVVHIYSELDASIDYLKAVLGNRLKELEGYFLMDIRLIRGQIIPLPGFGIRKS